jgi:hypothetical protein
MNTNALRRDLRNELQDCLERNCKHELVIKILRRENNSLREKLVWYTGISLLLNTILVAIIFWP